MGYGLELEPSHKGLLVNSPLVLYLDQGKAVGCGDWPVSQKLLLVE